MLSKLLVTGSMMAACAMLAAGPFGSIAAQTPEPTAIAATPEGTVEAEPTQVRPTQVPPDPSAVITINATLRLEVGVDAPLRGQTARIPEGARVQVIVGEGRICFDHPLSTTDIEALHAAKTLALPRITIPQKGVDPNCPEFLETFTVVLTLPDGSYYVLLNPTGFAPGAGIPTIELVISAPTAPPSSAPPAAPPQAPPVQLPSTGERAGGPSHWVYIAGLAMFAVSAGAFALSRTLDARRRDQ